MELYHQEILELPQRYRANLINSLSGIRQVALVGTQSKSGLTNLAIFNSLIHIGANPPYYGLLFRPDTVRRDTLTNILETGLYTINYVDTSEYNKAHQTSAKYDKEISEFKAAGFQEEYKSEFQAPFVRGALVHIGMKFEEQINIPLNGTILIIGSIYHISIKTNLLSDEGLIDWGIGDVLACSGLYQYYRVSEIGRLPYAKP
jgi:flavin reductase (DIM6/NTAB) family NADH-FMN oxidoreductase RutF